MAAKKLFIICALILSIVGIASAKSFAFTLSAPVKVGAAELKAGEYEVKLDKSEAVITGASKPVRVAVKVEQNDKKYAYTAVETTPKDGSVTIKIITLGGTTTRLVFGQ